MFGPIQSLIFDFDGTLVDTMSSVVRGLSAVVELGGGRKVLDEDLVKTFGRAPIDILRQWMPEEKVEVAIKLWTDFENALGPKDMIPFDGVEEMLAMLTEKKYFIGVLTGRDRPSTIKIMQAHGWFGKYFTEDRMVCGDDGLATKPDAAGILKLCADFKLDKNTTLMVGDHIYDMMSGRAAGVKTAAALWDLPVGQGTQRSRFKEVWTKWGENDCDLRLVSPGALMGWLSGSSSR